MSISLLLIMLFAPAVFWIGYFYYHDRFKPEPLLITAFAFFLGFLSGWLCLRFYDMVLPLLGIPYDPESLRGFNFTFLGYCVIVVGLVEEIFKFLPFLAIMRFSDFNEGIDGIFYASACALGFASYENVHYLPGLAGLFLFGRAFASPLTHTIFASIWGYMAGNARLRKKKLGIAVCKGLGLAALLHGLYDFLTYSPLLRLFSALLILAAWLWRIRASELLAKRDVA